VFILAAERDHAEDVTKPFRDYRQYLAANQRRFPPSAFSLATSSWYFDPHDHRCPHDAWLQELRIEEPASGERLERRTVALRVLLFGAYHDGQIELYYPRVFRYELSLDDGEHGHRDWRFDEFRVDDEGYLVHEIEWAGPTATGRWLVEASDIEFLWRPHGAANPVPAA
jgi:hypothetical protein